jgi:response regulator RpfG family c-di-GMP phosphodiesterase
MADLRDVLAALRAVADEHDDGEDSSVVDTEAGEDATEVGADNFRRKPRQSELLLAKVQDQAERAYERKWKLERLEAKRSSPVKIAELTADLKRKQLRSFEAMTAELEEELAIKQATDAQLKKLGQAHIALLRSKMTAKELAPADPHNWREQARVEFQNKKL